LFPSQSTSNPERTFGEIGAANGLMMSAVRAAVNSAHPDAKHSFETGQMFTGYGPVRVFPLGDPAFVGVHEEGHVVLRQAGHDAGSAKGAPQGNAT